MKLREYLTTPLGAATFLMVILNIVFLAFYTFILFVALSDFGGADIFATIAISIIGVSFGLIFIVVPLIVDVNIILIAIFALIVGLCPVILGILALIPALDIGYSFFVIFQLIFGVLLVLFSVLQLGIKKEKAIKESESI